MTNKQGKLNIGLTYYQELEWLSAIKKYGESIMQKSLLSVEQKSALIKASK
jgi:hypothetical protein